MAARFLADVCFDRRILRRLRDEGLVCLELPERDPAFTDAEIVDISARDQQVILSHDTDFGELATRQRRRPFGVVIVRSLDRSLAVRLLLDHARDCPHHLSVINNRGFRSRPLDFG